MELLRSPKKRTVLSEIAYYALNISLALAVLAAVLGFESPVFACVLVLLSKWRVFAVRPRFWTVNIKANLVDVIVGLGFVALLYAAYSAVVLQIILTILYVVWLLFVKPRSSHTFVVLQAGISQFVGVTAIMGVVYDVPSTVVVLLMWLIGYSTTRHLMTNYDESHRSFYSFLWGFVMAEIGWLGYHWNFAYTLPGFGDLKLSQVAIISSLLSFVAERSYDSYHRHNRIRSTDILVPTIFAGMTVLAILLVFNTIDSGTL